MEIHELAKYFPPLEGEEFDLLVEDINKNGLLEPITTHEGKILDGFNRYRACLLANVEPRYVEFNRGSALDYVISYNIRRRHLTDSQKTALSTEMLPIVENMVVNNDPDIHGYHEGEPNRSAKITADLFGVSSAQVSRAKKIKDESPDRFEAIKQGKATVRGIDTELRLERANQKTQARVEKKNKQERENTPREVKTYLDATKEFVRAVETAIKVAEFGKFSPESMGFVRRRHEKIFDLFTQLEEVFDEKEKEN
jgi:ParB-like chromosome segregation protein Spo0J